ncbi:hypothetical protein JD969_04360 [Planctomycetota bacterium]|nr:hypothetical protein JD969_04360 [Planctomycetota bacterium]
MKFEQERYEDTTQMVMKLYWPSLPIVWRLMGGRKIDQLKIVVDGKWVDIGGRVSHDVVKWEWVDGRKSYVKGYDNITDMIMWVDDLPRYKSKIDGWYDWETKEKVLCVKREYRRRGLMYRYCLPSGEEIGVFDWGGSFMAWLRGRACEFWVLRDHAEYANLIVGDLLGHILCDTELAF